jgi:hypothetical protein
MVGFQYTNQPKLLKESTGIAAPNRSAFAELITVFADALLWPGPIQAIVYLLRVMWSRLASQGGLLARTAPPANAFMWTATSRRSTAKLDKSGSGATGKSVPTSSV